MKRLRCSQCGTDFREELQRWRCDCGGALDLVFEPDIRGFNRGRDWTIWRYFDALPIESEDDVVTLGEGLTPILPVEIDSCPVLFKQEQIFPTASYKDRGAAVLVSRMKELGVTECVEDSSGNAGAAIAAYCARSGIDCRIYVPEYASGGKLAQISSSGAEIIKIPGSRQDVARAASEGARTRYYASHCWNPYFLHGTKTFAFELWEQLDRRVPDALVLPVGHGTLLLGAELGFRELRRSGLVSRLPRLVAVQAANCAPLCTDDPAYAPQPTLAEGIAIAAPARGRQIREAVRTSGGRFIAVEESEIIEALRMMGRRGFILEPTAAAAVAGVMRYLREAPADELVVSAFTGHGLKTMAKIRDLHRQEPAGNLRSRIRRRT